MRELPFTKIYFISSALFFFYFFFCSSVINKSSMKSRSQIKCIPNGFSGLKLLRGWFGCDSELVCVNDLKQWFKVFNYNALPVARRAIDRHNLSRFRLCLISITKIWKCIHSLGKWMAHSTDSIQLRLSSNRFYFISFSLISLNQKNWFFFFHPFCSIFVDLVMLDRYFGRRQLSKRVFVSEVDSKCERIHCELLRIEKCPKRKRKSGKCIPLTRIHRPIV